METQMVLTDLKPNLTLFTFVLSFFTSPVSFTSCGEHIHKHYVFWPLQQMNKIGLIMPVFSIKKTSFKEVIS